MPLFAVLPFLAPNAQGLVARAIRAHNAMVSGSAQVDVTSKSPSGEARTHLVVLWSPSSFQVEVSAPVVLGHLSERRVFRAEGGHVRGYDRAADEWIDRTAGRGTPFQQLSKALGTPPEALRFLGDPTLRNAILAPFGQAAGVSRKASPGSQTIRLMGGPKVGFASSQATFGSKNYLTAFSMSSAREAVTWRISYGSATAVPKLSIPRTAVKVPSFTEVSKLPRFASEEAAKVTIGLARAAVSLQSGQMEIKSDTGETRVLFAKGRFREDSPASSWAFDGSHLAIRGRGFHQGTAARSEVIDAVVECGAQLDPWVRAFLIRKNPILGLLDSNSIAEIGGVITFNGEACDILQLKGDRGRLTIFVSQRTRLPLSVEFVTADANGQTVLRSSRSIKYSRLGKVVGTIPFVLAPQTNERILPLPAPKKPRIGSVRG